MEKILIIDDDNDMQALLSDSIRPGVYEVITARSRKQALKAISPVSPVLILLDIKLPEVDGAGNISLYESVVLNSYNAVKYNMNFFYGKNIPARRT